MATFSLQLPNRLLKFEHIHLKKKNCFNPIEFWTQNLSQIKHMMINYMSNNLRFIHNFKWSSKWLRHNDFSDTVQSFRVLNPQRRARGRVASRNSGRWITAICQEWLIRSLESVCQTQYSNSSRYLIPTLVIKNVRLKPLATSHAIPELLWVLYNITG